MLDRVKKVETGTVFSTVVHSALTAHKRNFDFRFEKYSSSFSVDPSTGKFSLGTEDRMERSTDVVAWLPLNPPLKLSPTLNLSCTSEQLLSKLNRHTT